VYKTKRGSYFGTEIERRWWNRFREDGFFARGNGELWLDKDGLHFLRRLTTKPLVIRWTEITGIRLGRWHAGRWAMTFPILKVDFRRRSRDLSAGFLLSRNWSHMEAFARELRRKVSSIGAIGV